MLALLLIAATAVPPTPGTLCIGDKNTALTKGTCITTTMSVAVAPADQERLYVWTQKDNRPREVAMDDRRARDLESRAAARTGITLSQPVVDIGQLKIEPLPHIRGKVVDAENHPIGGAAIALTNASVCATADEQGAFVCEVEPKTGIGSIVVSKAGYGTRELLVAHGEVRDRDFGAIVLSRGVGVELKVKRPASMPDMKVSMLHVAPQYDHARVAMRTLASGDETVRFPDLEKGDYIALLEGKEPTERLAVPLKVADDEAVKEIEIAPYQLNGSVVFGDQPIQQGSIELLGPNNSCRSQVKLSDSATFSVPMWQTGELSAFVASPDLGSSELVRSPELGSDPSTWNVRIAKRQIAGRIFDAATNEAVTAHIEVDAQLDDRSYMMMSIPPGADGAYHITAKPGRYRFKVEFPDYAPMLKDVRVSEEDTMIRVDFPLERGVVQILDIVWDNGQPVPSALALEGLLANRVQPELSASADAEGRVELRGHPDEARTVYIVPREGSFAIVHVTMPHTSDDAKPMGVVVPRPVGTLHITTVDRNGQPVRAGVIVRYNGEYLPVYVSRFASATAGQPLMRNLPAGLYEIWATTGPADEDRLASSNFTLRAPVRVGVGSRRAVGDRAHRAVSALGMNRLTPSVRECYRFGPFVRRGSFFVCLWIDSRGAAVHTRTASFHWESHAYVFP